MLRRDEQALIQSAREAAAELEALFVDDSDDADQRAESGSA